MRIHRVVATAGVVLLSLTAAACRSKASSAGTSTAPAATTSAAAAQTSAAAVPAAASTAPASASPASATPASATPASATPASAAPASVATSSAASSSASAPAAAAGSDAVTFDGDYSGKLTTIVCVGSGPTTTASFIAAFTGKGTLPGDISSTEFGFQGPDDTQFDPGFLNNALDTDGKGFDVDGIVAKDESGKSVTMHGTLVCP
jgi:hypothetical protein